MGERDEEWKEGERKEIYFLEAKLPKLNQLFGRQT